MPSLPTGKHPGSGWLTATLPDGLVRPPALMSHMCGNDLRAYPFYYHTHTWWSHAHAHCTPGGRRHLIFLRALPPPPFFLPQVKLFAPSSGSKQRHHTPTTHLEDKRGMVMVISDRASSSYLSPHGTGWNWHFCTFAFLLMMLSWHVVCVCFPTCPHAGTPACLPTYLYLPTYLPYLTCL